MAYLEVTSKLEKRIRITESYWRYIIRVKHTELAGLRSVVFMALSSPSEVRRSRKDPGVYLCYGRHYEKFMCVVVKHINEEGFMITAYVTRKVGKGEVVWRS